MEKKNSEKPQVSDTDILTSHSDVEEDSSDIESFDSQYDSGENSDHQGFSVVVSRKKKKKGDRGENPKTM